MWARHLSQVFLLQTLSHPYIVAYRDSFLIEGACDSAMELIAVWHTQVESCRDKAAEANTLVIVMERHSQHSLRSWIVFCVTVPKRGIVEAVTSGRLSRMTLILCLENWLHHTHIISTCGTILSLKEKTKEGQHFAEECCAQILSWENMVESWKLNPFKSWRGSSRGRSWLGLFSSAWPYSMEPGVA